MTQYISTSQRGAARTPQIPAFGTPGAYRFDTAISGNDFFAMVHFVVIQIFEPYTTTIYCPATQADVRGIAFPSILWENGS